MLSAFTAPEVGELAGVTYRQLDHWVRQGWIVPSVNAAIGRGARRLFSPDDVVRGAALGRVGRARMDLAGYGPLIAGLDLTAIATQVIVAVQDPFGFETIDRNRVIAVLGERGPCVVYDPAPTLARLNPIATTRSSGVGPVRLRTVS